MIAIVQVVAVLLLLGASVGVLWSLAHTPFLAIPALLLACACVGLYQLRRWGAVLVCVLCWCVVALLLLLTALWGLADTEYPTAFHDPSFAMVFWSVFGLTVFVTILVSLVWRHWLT